MRIEAFTIHFIHYLIITKGTVLGCKMTRGTLLQEKLWNKTCKFQKKFLSLQRQTLVWLSGKLLLLKSTRIREG